MKNKNNKDKVPQFKDTESILESISDGVFTVDSNWCITSFNRAAEEITGIPRKEAIGKPCSEVFRASMCEIDCALCKTIETKEPVINKSAFIVDADGRNIPISVSTAILKDAHGNAIGGAETFRDMSLVEELRRELKGQCQLGDLVTRSSAMGKIISILPAIAESNSTVLIQGKTGTGKEVLAKTIHGLSDRRDKSFIAINCGALPDSLLESELFGYKAGAFTGAKNDKPGRFALAEGGTLFLDEIGEVSPALQVRLLRILQEKVYEPLGGTKSISSNVRVIAATNKVLAEEVQKGNFRQDLFYRINVVRIDLPTLKQRKEDIPWLIDHFVNKFNRLQNKTIAGLKPEAITMLMAHDFPGNIRELENIIEHAFVVCSKDWIDINHLPDDLLACAPKIKSSYYTMEEGIRELESQHIQAALKRNHNNRAATARELGMHKSTLYRKIKELNIALPKQDGRSKKSD